MRLRPLSLLQRPLSLSLRLFLFYAAFVALSGWFVLREVLEEVKPAVRQSTEETLVDTANLLAELAADDMRSGRLAQGRLPEVLARYGQRRPGANIWGIEKNSILDRIYIVDRRGIVLLDSSGRDVGKDYSRWNDVYLTLRGHYGARTTHEVPGDASTSVMYVAAPIYDGREIIGAVTVAKPNRSVQPVIEGARRRLGLLGGGLIAVGLVAGAVLSLWLSGRIRRLTRFALEVSAGQRASVPQLPGSELSQLAEALESMRTQLEGKAYVERYVQTLTHELKSPLAAIAGAAELLRGDMQPAERERFLNNIDSETARLQSLSERLLHLARVEQRRELDERVSIALGPLVDELLEAQAARLAARRLRADNTIPAGVAALGERFLVRQALGNLIDNAIDFTPEGGAITIGADASDGTVGIRVSNPGEPIPDYALPRVTERFYSLPRPATGRKSTGLGLSFVCEVAELHSGTFRIENVAGGVAAELRLPTAMS
ncbi:MAG TPA: two-component system sensor histidine kinase CreC [Polyangiaceae bacterium]|nr:two-component system sensor histidine kinase CreC [Polyangiaceae bacterium]